MSPLLVHPFPPIFDEESRILILGSFPSVRSREDGFYYAHPQNRFWRIMETLFDTKLNTVDEKKEFLHREHIALWDSIAECRIKGSSDAAIEDARANDIKGLIEKTRISAIFTNGNKSDEVYRKYAYKDTGIEAMKLPSTSPANAAYSLQKLVECWKMIKNERP